MVDFWFHGKKNWFPDLGFGVTGINWLFFLTLVDYLVKRNFSRSERVMIPVILRFSSRRIAG